MWATIPESASNLLQSKLSHLWEIHFPELNLQFPELDLETYTVRI